MLGFFGEINPRFFPGPNRIPTAVIVTERASWDRSEPVANESDPTTVPEHFPEFGLFGSGGEGPSSLVGRKRSRLQDGFTSPSSPKGFAQSIPQERFNATKSVCVCCSSILGVERGDRASPSSTDEGGSQNLHPFKANFLLLLKESTPENSTASPRVSNRFHFRFEMAL
ncbi:unnamed protein product [Linum trigynum]|uniref:Uncharacterized protein n=1 Tax=Linum trigynum TaxID=586398 RepID=A0AAV2EST7_9ROSI